MGDEGWVWGGRSAFGVVSERIGGVFSSGLGSGSESVSERGWGVPLGLRFEAGGWFGAGGLEGLGSCSFGDLPRAPGGCFFGLPLFLGDGALAIESGSDVSNCGLSNNFMTCGTFAGTTGWVGGS